MGYLDTSSLCRTVDAVNEAAFFGKAIPGREAKEIANWIVSRQGLPGAYGRLFAPTELDLRDGARLFTGERAKHAACRHILGEEACRALLLLGADGPAVKAAMETATTNILTFLIPPVNCRHPMSRGKPPLGTFCCGRCSVSVWRHLTAGGLDHREARMRSGVKVLKNHRRGDGTWRVFPFHYSLLGLVEMDISEAKEEMRYAGRRCEAMVKKTASANNPYSVRRRVLAERVLARV